MRTPSVRICLLNDAAAACAAALGFRAMSTVLLSLISKLPTLEKLWEVFRARCASSRFELFQRTQSISSAKASDYPMYAKPQTDISEWALDLFVALFIMS